MRAKKGLEQFLLGDRPVAIFGLGVSGMSALRLLSRQYPEIKSKLHVVNSNEVDTWAKGEVLNLADKKNCHSDTGPDTAHLLSICSLIILSPGIPRNHPVLEKAHLFNVPIWSEIELGFWFVHNPVIAITGSNGKTTTTTIIGEVFKNAGKTVFVGGNIGVPLCDYALTGELVDCVVLELSSFQLESIKEFKADIALILNLSLNHGERYSGLQSYGEAKWNITNKMAWKDFVIYDEDNDFLKTKMDGVKFSSWGVKTHRPNDLKRVLAQHYQVNEFKPIGPHNIVNLFFAIKSIEIYVERYVPKEKDLFKDAINKTIRSFKGVDHRIQRVEHTQKFIAFDDAKSTNFEATLTAVLAVENEKKPLWLILGGRPRGRGEDMGPFIANVKDKVDMILCFGECANFVEEQVFDQINLRKFRVLNDVVNYIRDQKFEGTLLFSPAFPSFDLYKNYEERGKHFVTLLNSL